MPKLKKQKKIDGVKYIKLKHNDAHIITALQNWVLYISNAGLISITLHFHIKRFVNGLKEIPLSEELQTPLKVGKKSKRV